MKEDVLFITGGLRTNQSTPHARFTIRVHRSIQ